MLRQCETASLHIQQLGHSQCDAGPSKLDSARTAPELVNRDPSGSSCSTGEPQNTLLRRKFIPASLSLCGHGNTYNENKDGSLFLPKYFACCWLAFTHGPAEILHLLMGLLLPFLIFVSQTLLPLRYRAPEIFLDPFSPHPPTGILSRPLVNLFLPCPGQPPPG